MTKSSPSTGATTALAEEVQRLAYLLRVNRADGEILSLTDHDQRIDFNDGSGTLTYVPDEGMNASAIASLFDANVDELEVTAFIQSGVIEYDDIISGRYDAAEIKVYLINWDGSAAGAWKMRRGNIGTIDFDEGVAKFQLLGMIQKMHSSTIGELVSSECRVEKFGDQGDLYPRCKIQLDAQTWIAMTPYAPARLVGSAGQEAGTEEVVVKPTSFNDRWFVLTTAGTSGATEPSWDTTIGNTTADGTCVWTTIRARRIDVSVDTITNHLQFTVSGYSGDAPDEFFSYGHAIFTNGNNLNIKKPIASWDLGTKTVTLLLPLNLQIDADIADGSGAVLLSGDEQSNGDSILLSGDEQSGSDVLLTLEPAVLPTLTLVAGCDRRFVTCDETYDNSKNYRGEPYLRGNDSFFTFPDAPSQ